MQYVLVVDADRRPLMPCRPARARLLLTPGQSGRAPTLLPCAHLERRQTRLPWSPRCASRLIPAVRRPGWRSLRTTTGGPQRRRHQVTPSLAGPAPLLSRGKAGGVGSRTRPSGRRGASRACWTGVRCGGPVGNGIRGIGRRGTRIGRVLLDGYRPRWRVGCRMS